MAWIESHQDIEDHPKTLSLMAKMDWDLDKTIGKLHRFWWWALKYAINGDLRRYNDGQLASAVGLNPDQGKLFVEAMVSCGGETASGFMDRDPYFRIHDWWHYAGKFIISKFKKDEEKWKRIRALYDNSLGNSEGNSSSNTTPTKPNQPNQPNLTIPYELFVRAWNDNSRPLPAVSKLTENRRQKVRLRWIEQPNIDYWIAVIRRMAKSSFARGGGSTGWVANFDFLITNDTNHVKVMEGKYDDKPLRYSAPLPPRPVEVPPNHSEDDLREIHDMSLMGREFCNDKDCRFCVGKRPTVQAEGAA